MSSDEMQSNQANEILLVGVNSRYHHTSFGLRYLYANLRELQSRAAIVEFIINKSPEDIVEAILAHNPRLVGLGVYIWNTSLIYEIVVLLKKIHPEIVVIFGGPEVSFESTTQKLFPYCDHVVVGEADNLFYELCRSYFSVEDSSKPKLKVSKLIQGALPDLQQLALPYKFYTDEDIRNRVVYVEASRGCPYRCEYCLSSLDKSVREFPLSAFLQEIDQLIKRGARQFKFLDRTFNLSIHSCEQILNFFMERMELGLFLHFEMVPDRLPQELRNLISKFPSGSLQFEIGVQTWNPEVAKRVSRRQNYEKIRENFLYLNEHTGVHTHADLIVGLPGESLQSFADGFDQLYRLGPDEIQVGILKRLKGTPIIRHDQEFQMIYSEEPPFQLLKNRDLDFTLMQKFGRFSKYWDLYANSGNFPTLIKTITDLSQTHYEGSMFWLFWNFSEFLYERLGQTHSIARSRLSELAKDYLEQKFKISADQLESLFQTMPSVRSRLTAQSAAEGTPARQKRHLTAGD